MLGFFKPKGKVRFPDIPKPEPSPSPSPEKINLQDFLDNSPPFKNDSKTKELNKLELKQAPAPDPKPEEPKKDKFAIFMKNCQTFLENNPPQSKDSLT